MTKDTAKTVYKQRFAARVRWARIGREFTQAQMAELLDIPQDKYKQYEGRSYLPHDLVPRFCLAAGIDTSWLFTGRGHAPAVSEPPAESPKQRKPRRAKKSKAA